jgi:hypothetical protein
VRNPENVAERTKTRFYLRTQLVRAVFRLADAKITKHAEIQKGKKNTLSKTTRHCVFFFKKGKKVK